jgi:ariadne-1
MAVLHEISYFFTKRNTAATKTCIPQVDSDPYVEPECPCGVSFCFKCSKAPHSPCTCAMWAMWDEKINGDSETRNWLAANTKPCPKCSKPVEKNGGCNLVMCKCGQVREPLCNSAYQV